MRKKFKIIKLCMRPPCWCTLWYTNLAAEFTFLRNSLNTALLFLSEIVILAVCFQLKQINIREIVVLAVST